jgi:hypothetical protein
VTYCIPLRIFRYATWLALTNDLPRRLIFFVAILASDIEPQEIGGRFSKEVSPRSELLHLIELILNQAMDGWTSACQRCARRNSVMTKAVYLSNRLGEGNVSFSLPIANELAAVIGLERESLSFTPQLSRWVMMICAKSCE